MTTTISNQTILTKEIIDSLQVGDMLPDIFGKMKPITSILSKGVSSVDGKMFLSFYQKFGNDSAISNSIKEGETIDIFFGPSKNKN